ncbi:MAG: hypothetical protein HXY27_01380 [Hydrogenophilaceae bacterium]|nr:hypothetical protein [Hydrogenophilaceae bacterium]
MKKAIVILISISVRVAYAYYLALFAAGLSIGIGLAFDSGTSTPALTLAGLYLFTFIPALLLALLPISVITKPPLPIKIWYGWIVLLASGLGLYGTYYWTSGMIKAALTEPHGTVCFVMSNPEQAVWIDIQTSEKVFHRFNSNSLSRSWCSNWEASHAPMQFRFYSATKQNFNGDHASNDDLNTVSETMSVKVTPNSKTCIRLALGALENSNKWIADVVSCESLSDPLIGGFKRN